MTDEIGRIVGIGDQAEPDGSHMVQVALGDCTIEVRIDREQVATLLNHFQLAAMVQTQTETRTLSFPEIDATQIALAHKGREVALMVSTAQMGTLVIRLTDDQMNDLRSELDRLKTYRSAPQQTQ